MDGVPIRTVSIKDTDGQSVLLNYADQIEVDGIDVYVTGIFRHSNGRVVVTFAEYDSD